jgi:hypothetical protein
MRIFFITVITILLGFSVFFAKKVHQDSFALNEMKYDFAEINRINYGLFNIPLWKEKIFDIVRSKMDEFNISEGAYTNLGSQVETYLYEMYDDWFSSGKLVDQLYESMSEGSSINKMVLNMVKKAVDDNIDKIDLKSQIPVMARSISKDIQKSEPELMKILQDELTRLLFDSSVQAIKDARFPVYIKYEKDNYEDTREYLIENIQTRELNLKKDVQRMYLILLLTLLGLLSAFKFIPFKEFILGLTALSIVFLILGVTLPMMDIDARLNAFSMELFDEKVEFEEQIMYFQSKSILDVTQTLWEGKGIDLKIVAALIFMFSIIFPFFKLLTSTTFLYVKRLQRSKVFQTIIFHLGKWSMADVFVVAMFMAYIGFYGLVTSQLGSISRNQTGYAVETLNYSKLSAGALFFTSYCILSIITSIWINKRANRDELEA